MVEQHLSNTEVCKRLDALAGHGFSTQIVQAALVELLGTANLLARYQPLRVAW